MDPKPLHVIGRSLSPMVSHFVERCLIKDQDLRPEADDLLVRPVLAGRDRKECGGEDGRGWSGAMKTERQGLSGPQVGGVDSALQGGLYGGQRGRGGEVRGVCSMCGRVVTTLMARGRQAARTSTACG